jgi:hypothetical protein
MIPFRGLNADYSEKEIRKCQNLFQITPKSYPNLIPEKRYDGKIPCIPETKIHKKMRGSPSFASPLNKTTI